MHFVLRIFFTCFLASFYVCSDLNADPKPLQVGVVLPLSGPVSGMGTAFHKGFVMYEQDHPQASAKFKFEDHKYDGKSALSAVYKLRDLDKVDLAIVWGNTPSDSVAPVAERIGMPLIAVSMNPVAKNRKHVVTFGPPVEKLIRKAFDKFNEWQIKQPAAVSIDIGNTIQSIDLFKKMLKDKLLVKIIPSEENDFKTLISGLKQNKIDGLLLFAFPDQALTFIRQASQLGFTPKILGGDIFADAEFKKEATKYLPDLAFVYGAVDDKFIERLQKTNGHSSYFFETASGYTLAALMDRLAAQTRTDLLAELREVNTSDVPILGLGLSETAEYGHHYEIDGAVYAAKE